MKLTYRIVLFVIALLGFSLAMDLGSNYSVLDETDLALDDIFFNLDEENFVDEPLLHDILYRIFEEDPSLLEVDEGHHFTHDRPTKIDYWETHWGLMLKNPDTAFGHW